MFDFVLFFLIFLPVMDGIRQIRSVGKVQKFMIQGIVTSAVGTYFVYTTILAEKP